MKRRFIEVLQREGTNAKQGKGGRIITQMNGVMDVVIVKELYEVSQTGVDIDLIGR